MIPQRKSSIFPLEKKAVMRKPQYQAIGRVRQCVEGELSHWLTGLGLQGWQIGFIANLIAEKACDNKQNAISPSAPDVFLVDKDWTDLLVSDGKKMAMQMDESGEIDRLLNQEELRMEAEKHGVG